MPIFFKKEELTLEQQARYESALERYKQIQTENVEREKEILRLQGKLTPEIEQSMNAFLAYHTPSEKSALFSRLLDGKEPLEHAPPTSFSYPWYDVIEGSGPWDVMIGGLAHTTEQFKRKHTDDPLIIINQAIWSISDMNEAARTLYENPELKENELKTLFNQKPVFTVYYQGWGNYNLQIGRKKSYGRRDALERESISLSMGGTNPVFIKITTRGEEYLAQENKKREALLARSFDSLSKFEQKMLNHTFKKPDNPRDYDWGEGEVDGWILEKIKKI